MYQLLILCTGNSCRSIIGEALINHLASNRFHAYSAGSRPTGKINPNALKVLAARGIATNGFKSQSWHEFTNKKIDMVISVCDNAANETCPAYLQASLHAHWGLVDPAIIQGTEMEITAAFEHTYLALEKRIQHLLALPFEQLSDSEKVAHTNSIGLIDD